MLNRIVSYSTELVNSYFLNENTKKEILSELFGEVSDTLMKASIELEDNKFPEESCSIIKELTNNIILYTKNGKRDKHITKLHSMLSNCSNLKSKYEKNEIPSVVCDLRKASQEFKALSMAISM